MNFEQARFNMVEQQVRTWDVLDSKVLDLLATLPRERFVPAAYQSLAFADISIPLAQDSMSPPREEGRMLQALRLKRDDIVLDIGTGSGYSAALLGGLARKVYSVELNPELADQARHNLDNLHITNVQLEIGDASLGLPAQAPYDAIHVSASVSHRPQALLEQLKIGGRLFAIQGQAPAMVAMLYTRTADNQWSEQALFETARAPLKHDQPISAFVF